MVQRRLRLEKFRLGVEQTWDTRESTNMEAKILREQGTNGSYIVLARE